MYRRVVTLKVADVSHVRTASIIMAIIAQMMKAAERRLYISNVVYYEDL
jgi:hypothetical protein